MGRIFISAMQRGDSRCLKETAKFGWVITFALFSKCEKLYYKVDFAKSYS